MFGIYSSTILANVAGEYELILLAIDHFWSLHCTTPPF